MLINPRQVNLAEADIERYIFENPQLVCNGKRRRIDRWLRRQYRVPSGIIDLLGLDEMGDIVVVELKNTELKRDAILQVKRYAFDIDQMMVAAGVYSSHCYPILIGASVGADVFLDCEACGVDVQTFRLSFSMTIDRQVWTRDFLDERYERHEKLSRDAEIAMCIAEIERRESPHLDQSLCADIDRALLAALPEDVEL